MGNFRNPTERPQCFDIDGVDYVVGPGEVVRIPNHVEYVVAARRMVLERAQPGDGRPTARRTPSALPELAARLSPPDRESFAREWVEATEEGRNTLAAQLREHMRRTLDRAHVEEDDNTDDASPDAGDGDGDGDEPDGDGASHEKPPAPNVPARQTDAEEGNNDNAAALAAAALSVGRSPRRRRDN